MNNSSVRPMLKIVQMVLLICGSILVTDCVWLFTLKKINFGTVVPFLIGVVFLVHALRWQCIQQIVAKRRILRITWKMLWLLFFAWLLSFALFVSALINYISKPISTNSIEAIIVLGAGTTDGKPTQALANRLDTATHVFKQHPQAILITTGGIGFGKKNSEASIMSRYLQNQHSIDKTVVKEEGKSTSTEENVEYSRTILADNNIALTDSIAIVTNDFHTIRATLIARKLGYTNTVAIAAPTPVSIRANAWFREYFAYVSGWLLNEF